MTNISCASRVQLVWRNDFELLKPRQEPTTRWIYFRGTEIMVLSEFNQMTNQVICAIWTVHDSCDTITTR
ncbi:hypothetical protein AQUCO_00600236v1 [Aquilegia coerulea]|uniref:Uncharacterized protein n=1 Tax=Aquilegia coerulea TaxID=218851 RepID=A0A2G5ENK9_AQUCA|nr:hypothetical protein AQUCO_00600236v1 [Aquilegia coerulea]